MFAALTCGCGHIDLHGFSCDTHIIDSNRDNTFLSRFQTSHQRGVNPIHNSILSTFITMAPGNDVEVIGVSGRGPTNINCC